MWSGSVYQIWNILAKKIEIYVRKTLIFNLDKFYFYVALTRFRAVSECTSVGFHCDDAGFRCDDAGLLCDGKFLDYVYNNSLAKFKCLEK